MSTRSTQTIGVRLRSWPGIGHQGLARFRGLICARLLKPSPKGEGFNPPRLYSDSYASVAFPRRRSRTPVTALRPLCETSRQFSSRCSTSCSLETDCNLELGSDRHRLPQLAVCERPPREGVHKPPSRLALRKVFGVISSQNVPLLTLNPLPTLMTQYRNFRAELRASSGAGRDRSIVSGRLTVGAEPDRGIHPSERRRRLEKKAVTAR